VQKHRKVIMSLPSNAITDPIVDPVTDPVVPEDDGTMVPIAELRKVRAEAANNRKALQEYKEKIKSQEEAVRIAGLDEISKAQALLKKAEDDNKALRDSMNRVQFESAIVSLASTLGFTDPQDVVKFINLSDIQDDQGEIDNAKIETAVKKLSEDKPYLRSNAGRQSFGATNPAPPDSSFPRAQPKLIDQNNIDNMIKQASDLTRQGRVGEATRLYNRAWELDKGIKK